MVKLTFTILLLSCTLISFAQKFNRKFLQITTEEGLSQSHVKTIYQDSRGFMWFGTDDGLNRYDGRTFKIYTAGNNTSQRLVHSSINAIYPRNKQELWICTNLGVSIYNMHTDEVKTFHHLENLNVKVCLQDKQGFIWFGTQTGLYLYNPVTDSMRVFKSTKSPKSISNNHVFTIYQDKQDNIWIGTEYGLNLWNRTDENFTRFLPDGLPGSITGYSIRTISEDKDDRLWIGSNNSGLELMINDKNDINKKEFRKFFSGRVNCLLSDKNKNLWMGLGGTGRLYLINLEEFDYNQPLKYESFEHERHNKSSLSDNSISSLFEDKNGDIWIGTYAGGVNFHSERIKQFENFTVNASPDKTIGWHLVNCFLDDGPYLWIGTGAGLDRLEKSTGLIKNFFHDPNNKNSISMGGVYALHKDSKGNLWAGTWNGGLNRFDSKTGNFKRYQPDGRPGSINSPNIYAIHEDSKGRLWIGTIGGGLNQYHYNSDSFTHYVKDPNNPASLDNNSINAILETSDGTLLISCYSALEIFDPQTGTFQHFIHQPGNPLSIGNGQILSIFEDSNRNIWIATNMGLNLFNKDKGTFYRITTEQGLPNSNIQGILEDDEKNLWISTNVGILKFINGVNDPYTPKFKLFDKHDGLISNDFNVRSAYRGSDGYMNFGSSRGFTRFHPKFIFENQIAPQIILTGFNLIGMDTQIELPALQKTDINEIQTLTLKYTQNNFEIQFIANNFLHPEKNQYKFMLEGYETQWRNASTLPLATYTNINPGRYTFLVTGTNNDGVWSENPKVLQIVIVPPWWQTRTFIITLLLVLLALSYYLIRRRFALIKQQNRQLEEHIAERTRELSEANKQLNDSKEEITLQNRELEKHRHRLEELVKERTAELEKAKEKAEHSDRLKTSFMANLSHEIRTPMNAIVGFSNLLTQPDVSEDERHSFVKIISSNSEALLILINDILDISIIETNQLKLTPKWFSVNSLLKELEQYFQMRNDHQITIKTIPETDTDLKIFNDEIRIRQILSNLLTNAMKFTNNGHIYFGYKTIQKTVTFFVEDTGIGIQPKEIENIFIAFYKIDHPEGVLYRGTGLGLSLCKRLIEQMNGKIWVESEPGKGSTFYFTIPIELLS